MIGKVKSHMELSLIRDVKSSEFGSLKCISSRNDISFLKKKYVGLLLNGAGTKKMERADLLRAFSAICRDKDLPLLLPST